MGEFVYLLCVITSAICAGLLIRGYRRSRTSLLMWSAMCFACLAVANFLLVIDLLIVPGIDLMPLRLAVTFAGLVMLVHGLIWESV